MVIGNEENMILTYLKNNKLIIKCYSLNDFPEEHLDFNYKDSDYTFTLNKNEIQCLLSEKSINVGVLGYLKIEKDLYLILKHEFYAEIILAKSDKLIFKLKKILDYLEV